MLKVYLKLMRKLRQLATLFAEPGRVVVPVVQVAEKLRFDMKRSARQAIAFWSEACKCRKACLDKLVRELSRGSFAGTL